MTDSYITKLDSNGHTDTDKIALEWTQQVIGECRKIFNDSQISASIWSYRYGFQSDLVEYLCCDFSCAEHDSKFLITISSIGHHHFPKVDSRGCEADTFDMPEAIHLVGLLTTSLKANISLGRP
jgi:hypothetical protein